MSDRSRSYKYILVVDDDPLIRDMMVDILEDCHVETARNGSEALVKLRGENDYLVFLDLMMPLMTGEELVQHLDNEPALRARHTIILMSAAALLAQTQALHVDGTMPKPFTYEDVMDVVERWVR